MGGLLCRFAKPKLIPNRNAPAMHPQCTHNARAGIPCGHIVSFNGDSDLHLDFCRALVDACQ